MKIIVDGKYYQSLGTCLCDVCKCVFEYNSQDIKTAYKDQTIPFYNYVTCPQCDNRIMLEDKQ